MTLPVLPGMTINVRTPEGLATRLVRDVTPAVVTYDGGTVLRASTAYAVDYSVQSTVDLTLREIARRFNIPDEAPVQIADALGYWLLVAGTPNPRLCASVPAGRLDMRGVLDAFWVDSEPKEGEPTPGTIPVSTPTPAPEIKHQEPKEEPAPTAPTPSKGKQK